MSDIMTVDYIDQNRDRLVAELGRRQAVIRDYVRGVARQYSTGLYLFGAPGTAKTHTVRAMLEHEVREIYTYQRGHLTPIGLFELLRDHRNEVIVLDDLAALFNSPTALQLLLAALEHPTAGDFGRRIEYRRQGASESFSFSGGVICISNLELHDSELLNAFKSRVHVLNYAPTDAQLGAQMLDLVSRGWPAGAVVPSIKPTEARDVARHVIGELLRLRCRFDLRLLVGKALPDFQQWKDGETETDWRELVTASIEEHLAATAPAVADAVTRETRKEEERNILRAILKTHASREDRVRVWMEQTGKSERAFYRRLVEIDSR